MLDYEGEKKKNNIVSLTQEGEINQEQRATDRFVQLMQSVLMTGVIIRTERRGAVPAFICL